MQGQMQIGTGELAFSRAGHDKGRLYVVLSEEDGYCLLCDGRLRPLEKPKRKKKIHLQRIVHLPEEIQQKLCRVQTDADVRAVLRQYQNKSDALQKQSEE